MERERFDPYVPLRCWKKPLRQSGWILKPRANSLKRKPANLRFFDLRRRLEHDYQQDLKIAPRRKKSRPLRLVVVRLTASVFAQATLVQ
jgi:hypothetical protein